MLEAVILDVVVDVREEPLLEARLGHAEVRLQRPDLDLAAIARPDREVAHPGALHLLHAIVEVVRVQRHDRAALADRVERSLLGARLEAVVPVSGQHHPEAAEGVAVGDLTAAAERRVLAAGRSPAAGDLLSHPLEIGAAEADAEETALAHNCPIGKVGRQRLTAGAGGTEAHRVLEQRVARGLRVVTAREADGKHLARRETPGHQFDRPGGEVARLFRRVRLPDRDVVQQVGIEQVEWYDLALELGRRNARPVQCRVAVAVAKTADIGELAVLKRDAGHPAQGVGGVRTAVLRDLLRADVVDDLGRCLALGEQRGSGSVDRGRLDRDRLRESRLLIGALFGRHEDRAELRQAIRLDDDVEDALGCVAVRRDDDRMRSRRQRQLEDAVDGRRGRGRAALDGDRGAAHRRAAAAVEDRAGGGAVLGDRRAGGNEEDRENRGREAGQPPRGGSRVPAGARVLHGGICSCVLCEVHCP